MGFDRFQRRFEPPSLKYRLTYDELQKLKKALDIYSNACIILEGGQDEPVRFFVEINPENEDWFRRKVQRDDRLQWLDALKLRPDARPCSRFV